ncbi:MAG: radical SAM family heme chaperone HemW [Gammaproteobacteria bacterium]|nr:radical SAM family heme chaperone HemW [Gammaproteobacteria bacterium]NIR97143.1 radical SAM family heme chaperone HemW [Gammaproteobacteria bacterium]NIT62841.1 radical SAM family heme chaperone HemW [Gammaproteobacteria bacterium]NIV19805.1 radical SAM family heme chaperone HemW [Gammaproteobacteria bacterium]NIX11338.1 radical SAM family heme chaperone HemW [Gammaproteobacteria bacterium]
MPETDPIPLALYVHVPWCVRKCPYCDFNSHGLSDPLPERRYVEALLADLEAEAVRAGGREVTSVFIGGGTPSLLSAAALRRLLAGIDARLRLAPGAEVTLEANPGTAEQARFCGYRAAGVNRLSIGVQSFSDGLLLRLGRIHTGEEARAAVAAARAAGFDNLNLDLMYGLPDQSQDQALQDLAEACALRPEHFSWYHLTVEPNTLFYRRPPELPSDEQLWAMQVQGEGLLRRHGYARYEVSAHARGGRQCRHNRNYWEFGDYLGIGAGAHGKLTDPAAGRIVRRWKHRHPRAYLAGLDTGRFTAGRRTLDKSDTPLEFMMNAMRLSDGVSEELFRARTGLPPTFLEPGLSLGAELGLIGPEQGRLHATALGHRFLNDLLALFVDGGDLDYGGPSADAG